MLVNKVTRRTVLRHGMYFSLGSTTILGLGACSDSGDMQSACNAPGQLSDGEMNLRTSLGYVDVSSIPGEVCGGCEYFTPGGSGSACGSCQLLPGQVSSEGRCESWSAKS